MGLTQSADQPVRTGAGHAGGISSKVTVSSQRVSSQREQSKSHVADEAVGKHDS
jgi:hypothetical protein